MKSCSNKLMSRCVILMLCTCILQLTIAAQEVKSGTENEPAAAERPKKTKQVKNTFESVWLIDNQSVLVPIKKTFEMDIMHRFGSVKNGYKDFFGLFAPSNIRLGFSYVPIKNLNIGFGFTKENLLWDVSAKYALITQTRGAGGYPVSVTYYGNAAMDTREKSNFIYYSQRFFYFNQLIVARKVTDKFSVQVAPSVSHQNAVYGFFKYPTDSTTEIGAEMKHDHFAVAVAGRYKIKEGMSVIANYDQPLTRHVTNNPNPNVSLGLEMTTSGHTFQVFAGNYYSLNPQRNNLFNRNDIKDRKFVIGFNITRLSNY